MCRFQDGFRKGPRRIEPVPVKSDIDFATLDPVHRQPVHEFWIAWPAQTTEHGDPCGKRIASPGEAGDGAIDPCPRLGVEPVRRLLKHRFEPAPERDQRPQD